MAPIRFFCKRCNLMMKIGASMFGRGVVCPQCGERLTVPFESDPQAEALYRFMKQKRAEEKAASAVLPPPQPSPPAMSPQAASASPPSVPSSPRPEAAPEISTGASLEELEPDEVERWIDQFWATVPETDENGVHRGEAPHTTKYSEEPVALGTPELASTLKRFDQTRTLFRILLGIVFVTGFFLGLFAHSRYIAFRYGRNFASPSSSQQAAEGDRIMRGELYYIGLDGARRPDADAVVIALPLGRPPTLLIGSEGLKPNDELFDPNGENVILIEEIGGVFQRTGADGAYRIPYPNEGRYRVLMISSHVKRPDEEEPDPSALRKLREFFADAPSLIGPYRFSLEEYDFTGGQYQVNHTFQ